MAHAQLHRELLIPIHSPGGEDHGSIHIGDQGNRAT